ncbi:MAG: dihydropyrimidinase [Candidatus Eisenbacteria sp.]|nr:dihydropyrimidinase [Candidatus Eisenbacteria bacterium]
MDLIIRNGTVVTPEGPRPADIGIEDGTIVSVGSQSDARASDVVDASGCYVFPGGIDPHVHFELPTGKAVSSDSFVTGSEAALCGGTTSFLDFALFDRDRSLEDRLRERRRAADGRTSADYGFHMELGAVDIERLGEIRNMANAGQRSFKTYMAFDNREVEVGENELRRFAEVLADSGGLLMVHAEEGGEVRRLQEELNAHGNLAPVHHPRARPAEIEARAIDIVLGTAKSTGAEVYVVHVSSRVGLERIREWRAKGVRVRAETCPHYLLLTEDVYAQEHGVQFLANPPLKKLEDMEALWEGIRDGTIDTVATDHCPFARSVKMRYRDNFLQAPKGLPGVETRLPVMFSEGVVRRGLPVERLAELLSGNPARIFGLSPAKGRVAVGGDADLVVFDPRREITISATDLHMNTDFNPLEGRMVQGWPAQVFLRGRRVYHNGVFLGCDADGRYLG